VEVPNYDSMLRRRKRGNWSGLRPLEHIIHFTPRTLARAFTEAGLHPAAIRTPTYVLAPQTLPFALADLALEQRRWTGALARTCTTSERDGEQTLIPTRLTWAILRAFERAYALRRAGVVVVGVARAP
jgi:hypothetical protein